MNNSMSKGAVLAKKRNRCPQTNFEYHIECTIFTHIGKIEKEWIQRAALAK